MGIIYGSRLAECKQPYGACHAGMPVTMTIYPPRTLGVIGAQLYIHADQQEDRILPLEWIELDYEHAEDVYRITFEPEAPGLYWYSFCIQTIQGPRWIGRGHGGIGQLCDQVQNYFQLTVTDGNYTVPTWFGEGIAYNIFPDRFARTHLPATDNCRNDRVIHENWSDCPEYRPDNRGEIKNNDFFGGNFDGIREKLPYLKSLGVTTLYLNPIFEASSNHRYDTGDYMRPDPMLGTLQDFERLCTAAKEQGIRIMLDGVFSHTGNDSRYFNAKNYYPDSVGAYQSQDSRYYHWYKWKNWPNQYESWWGIYTLPEVDEMNPDYLHYIADGPDSVVRHWLRLGASAWRLDVADELPDEFIQHINTAAKSVHPDAMVLGEVWEDASNKISYGVRRRYFQGGELDSVMNYPLSDSLAAFLAGGSAEDFEESMEIIRENYPRDIFYNLMNIIGTHDTARALTVYGATPQDWQQSRDYRAQHRLSGEALRLAKCKLLIASTIQFTMPGTPCIYYGDEAGLQGFEDPFNRRTYPWGSEDPELLAHYRQLGHVRTHSEVIRRGELHFLQAEDTLLVYERRLGRDCVVVAVNRSEEVAQGITLELENAVNLMTDKQYHNHGSLSLTLPPLTVTLLGGTGNV